MEISPSDYKPDVYVPDEIWRRVRPWEADVLRPFDIRLRHGQTLVQMYINSDGLICGQLTGDTTINVSAVYFEADEILAVRPRGGSILQKAGLTPWIRRKDAVYLKDLRERNKKNAGLYRMIPGIPMGVFCIMILMFGASLFLLQSENNEQVAGLKEEALVLKAAFVRLDEVAQFNRLFPKAWFQRLFPKASYSPLCFIAKSNQDALDVFYRCELPKYTIKGPEVTFHGKVKITANKLVFTDHSARSEVVSELTIDELKKEFAGKLSE